MTKIEWLKLAKQKLGDFDGNYVNIAKAITYINEVIELIEIEEGKG